MRRYVYFDSDGLNSFLAQIDKGLNTSQKIESQTGTEIKEAEEISSSATGDIGAKILGIGASIKGEFGGTLSSSEATKELVQNIDEKILHDYVFDKVYSHLQAENLIKADNYAVGDFVLATNGTTMIDFNYFNKLFSDDGPVKFFPESEKQLLLDVKNVLPKGNIPEELKQKISEADKKIAHEETERKKVLKMISLIQNTVPYNRALMSENLLFTLDDNCFRCDPEIFAFKYGSNVKVLGYITNIIVKGDSEAEQVNMFQPLYKTVNEVMLTLFPGKDSVFVVHPVAIYF